MDLDIQKKVQELSDFVENYDNKKKKNNWYTVYEEGLDTIGVTEQKQRNTVLIKTVTEITRRGYEINDEPFKLTRFR